MGSQVMLVEKRKEWLHLRHTIAGAVTGANINANTGVFVGGTYRLLDG